MAESNQPQAQQQPAQQQTRPLFSGTTQVVVASIGAIGTISGALIAANWGRNHEPVAQVQTQPTQATSLDANRAGGGALVFPGSGTAGTTPSAPNAIPPQLPAPNPALFGDWRMADGSTTSFQQQDDGWVNVSSQLQMPNGTAMFAGRGQAAGDYLRWQYQGNTGDSGQCIVQLVAGGQQLGGYCQHANGSTNQILLAR